MKKQLSITTDFIHLHGLLNSEIPEGVSIVSAPPIETRGDPGFGVSVNIDIQIVIDLAKIAPWVVAGWLAKRCNKFPGKHIVNINRRQISVEDPTAIEHIAKEIEEKN